MVPQKAITGNQFKSVLPFPRKPIRQFNLTFLIHSITTAQDRASNWLPAERDKWKHREVLLEQTKLLIWRRLRDTGSVAGWEIHESRFWVILLCLFKILSTIKVCCMLSLKLIFKSKFSNSTSSPHLGVRRCSLEMSLDGSTWLPSSSASVCLWVTLSSGFKIKRGSLIPMSLNYTHSVHANMRTSTRLHFPAPVKPSLCNNTHSVCV